MRKFWIVILGIIVAAGILYLISQMRENRQPDQAFDPSRLQKTELVAGLDEPMELAVLPDLNILFIERKGAIRLFFPQTDALKTIAELEVFHDLEDGLLGLALDPDYKDNHFIYLFYSPPGDKPIQRVSRFVFKETELDKASENILIEIPTQREECCHSAGSLAFGPDGTLYIAVGDNTNPHNPGYYNSIDERPGREYWDAQRTAANTDDLRGKILRIKPLPEGGYSIPEGNLFPADGSGGRPEIYAMGCRNPYRITVDQKNNYLYWGDVGQNTEDNPARGPISYDEFHRATDPGFFGWPYFAGDNEPYADFDFATEEIGPFFDPLHPVNDSPNNTGRRELPPAQGALIWYSYDSSEVFPHLGTGGKSPIIGPVFYSDLVDQTKGMPSVQLHEYFDGKLFIAEWMRDWVNVVSFHEDGTIREIEPFMAEEQFNHPIDLELGPDGALYVLEYGTFWFSKNQDSRLSKIEYVYGNRPPVAKIKVDKTAGAAPMTVRLSAEDAYDPDQGDELKFLWTLSSGKFTSEKINYTFDQPGEYEVLLTVEDKEGLKSQAVTSILVGNEPAAISMTSPGNTSFYWPGEPFEYQIEVEDAEDGSLASGSISPSSVAVRQSYYKNHAMLKRSLENTDEVSGNTVFFGGYELINQNDCKACHDVQEKSVGPTYMEIAERYPNDDASVALLSGKIIKGGSGNWGETAMSAHPQLREEEANEMVKYILSLAEDSRERVSPKGSFTPSKTDSGSYLISAAYEDQGSGEIRPLMARKDFVIRNHRMPAVSCDSFEGVAVFNEETVRFTADGAYIKFEDIDLTGLKEISYTYFSRLEGVLECRIGSITGKTISAFAYDPVENKSIQADASKPNDFTESGRFPLEDLSGVHDVYFVFKDKSGEVGMWNGFELAHIQFHK